MNIKDPWKYLAFPASAVSAFFAVQLLIDDFSQITGLSELNSQIALLAGTGLVIGFLVDEMLPAYIEKVREGSSSGGGGGDFGGDGGDTDFGGGDDGGGDDFDF
jgi:uncharacterized membrane protein YgcG